jgi:hypothetical protein
MKDVFKIEQKGVRRGRTTEGVTPTKKDFKYICKYHYIFPIQLLYANKMIKKLKKK